MQSTRRSRTASPVPVQTAKSPSVGGCNSPAVESTPATAGAAKAQNSQTEAAIDRSLIQRFNGGDEAAFVEIVTRYREKIHAIAERFLRNRADAEEIAQDTFIRAHRGLANFRGDSSLATWLHRIVVNLARNRYWYLFRRRQHLTLSLDCPLGPDNSATFTDLVASTEADPSRQASVDEFVVMVATCMDKLEPCQREILTLRNLLHRSYEDIARTLGTNEGTVKSRIARARGSLRGVIARTYPEFPGNASDSDWFEPARGTAQAA